MVVSGSCSCLSIHLSTCKLENEAILRDCLNFWFWQHQKHCNSARIPQFLKLTTSKTLQFCETSSIFQVDNVKNEAILRDFSFKNGTLSAELTASYQCVLWFFGSICLKYCACHEKCDARSYEVLHLSREIILANLRISCSKMQPLWGNQRPHLLTSLMNMSLVLRLRRKMYLSRSSSNRFWKCYKTHILLTFEKVRNPLRLPRKPTSERPKVLRPSVFCTFDFKMCFAPQRRTLFRHLNFQKCSEADVFCTFWLGNELRATTAFSIQKWSENGVLCTFWLGNVFRATTDISTSKSAPKLTCFVHFGLEMCFAAQRHALFRHHNYQKWSDVGLLSSFWLANAFRATMACNFSSLIWPHGSAPAALASLPSGVFCDFPTWSYLFAHLHLLSSHTYSSLIFSLRLFSSLTLPTSAYPSVHIVGSLSSKLPFGQIHPYAAIGEEV